MKKVILIYFLTLGLFACKNSTNRKNVDNEVVRDSLITNNLIVESGQVLTIPPRLYNYDTILVKANGTLKINNNSSTWVVFNVKNFICYGTIEYTNFKRGLGTVSFTLENGEKLEHTYVESIGGRGGDGGGNNRKQGGRGYSPDSYEGGGGGSGAYYQAPNQNDAGNSATDYRGAQSRGNSSFTYGGNGGRQPFGHGGLIYIISEKIVFGTSTKFNLRGSDGINGLNGGNGRCYSGGQQPYSQAGGGGGGGTSGGNGGVLKVKCSNVTNTPYVNVNPGKGGEGGKGGNGGSRCTYNGSNGLRGETGGQGYVDWY